MVNKPLQNPQQPIDPALRTPAFDAHGAAQTLHAVIPAAGRGQRFDPDAASLAKAKQYHDLAGKAVIVRSIEALLAVARIDCVWVVLAPGDQEGPQRLAEALSKAKGRLRICHLGGAERRDSVLAGIKLAVHAGADWVMVHDAARPLVSRQALDRLISSCFSLGSGGILALPVVDTVKRARPDRDGLPREQSTTDHAMTDWAINDQAATDQAATAQTFIEQTMARERLWLAQTPQLFPAQRLIQALEQCPRVTDEAGAMEQLGDPVLLVRGERSNIKLTYADDLEELELLLKRSTGGALRVGEGYDVHALVPGRALLIGGVRIDYPLGLLGHSDADVLLHAITDALLGAAGLGDIGTHFPDHEAVWRGADSRILMAKTVQIIKDQAWSIQNIDCTVVAQRPKLSPYREAIIESIAGSLGVAKDAVNFKAKTQELLGFEGRGEGISARAVALLARTGEQT
ncbi:MAG: 2-C-methyl-D-erythritol 2,4-cyclodiphosphate synthase [Betaproteobacteria bacterium]|nr:2-C-methyl-D-erythritol 2,4-cyclodiphosphate synthase [Betaproteobacteria bacterium]